MNDFVKTVFFDLFLFATGYGPEVLPPRFRDRPLLRKPCTPRAVIAALKGVRER